VKNQNFILDLAAIYTTAHDDAYFVLVGEGALRTTLEQRALQLGLADRIRFAGARDDVPELLLGLFDAFLLPSLAEGLPISYLEAQAAGLPALISDRIPAEARVLPAVEVLGIGQPAAEWASALDRLRGQRVEPQAAQALLRQAGFEVEDSVHHLERRYRELLGARGRLRNLARARHAQ
jgi:glycosyltransferase involved in cell wall biosynthesis